MKGVLFNVVEDVVQTTLPADSWDHAVMASGCGGAYTSLGDYPAADLERIVGALAEQTGLPPEDVLRHAGRHGFAVLAERHPELLEQDMDLGDLLHGLDGVIHPEVLKLYPSAQPPSFAVRDTGPDRWELVYESRRGLCHLAEGLLVGAAEFFGRSATVEQPTCVHRGDDRCVLIVQAPGS
ncbi:MAG: heme NO-binding domain-containing protein [Microthrixaceae bacterium]